MDIKPIENVTYIFHEAIKQRASDIHFQPEGNALNVRFRIDGLLHLYKSFDVKYSQNIVSKVKIDAKMNITENRLPQDGHIGLSIGEYFYNIRVSSLPTIYGEALVLRFMNRDESLLNLTKLGFEHEQLQTIYKLIQTQGGMILATGPTGSGKTNLLYSILNYLNKPEVNIMTLEDPIEYQLSGIRQTQLDDTINFSFARALRAVVRQDPNVIMLGEIRDEVTADMAIQASLIGIFVLSTFHTFDVPALISRLVEMNVANSVLGQTLNGVISSRLVRKICNNCKESYQSKDTTGNIITLYRGTGCESCNRTGYYGRVGVYEVVEICRTLKTAIIEKKSSSVLQQILIDKKIQSLRTIAMKKVYAGITTYDEIVRVLGLHP